MSVPQIDFDFRKIKVLRMWGKGFGVKIRPVRVYTSLYGFIRVCMFLYVTIRVYA